MQIHMLALELPRDEPRKGILRWEGLKLMERMERNSLGRRNSNHSYALNECRLRTECSKLCALHTEASRGWPVGPVLTELPVGL